MVHPQNDPPVVISKSLFERLKTYALENGLSISAALGACCGAWVSRVTSAWEHLLRIHE